MAALGGQKTALAQLDAIHTGVAKLSEQLGELTIAIVRMEEAQAARALDLHQSGARDRLVQWILRRRILLALLPRSRAARKARVHAEAAALGIADQIAKPFVKWLSRRRTLLKLLRRPAGRGRAIVLRALIPGRHNVRAMRRNVRPGHRSTCSIPGRRSEHQVAWWSCVSTAFWPISPQTVARASPTFLYIA